MTAWPADNTPALIAFYGNPMASDGGASPIWEASNLGAVAPPWKMVASWSPTTPIRSCRVHKKIIPTLVIIFAEIWDAAGHDQKKIQEWGMHLYGGGFNFRAKRGLASLSTHAFGAALDFDPARNGLGNKKPKMAPEVVAAFKKHGAVWGGDFKSRKDGMHFQFATI